MSTGCIRYAIVDNANCCGTCQSGGETMEAGHFLTFRSFGHLWKFCSELRRNRPHLNTCSAIKSFWKTPLYLQTSAYRDELQFARESFQDESVQLRRPQRTHMWQRVFLLPGSLLQLVIGFPSRSGIKDKFRIGVQRLWFSLLSVLLWLQYVLKFTAVSLYIILHISNWGLFRFSQVQ